MAADMRRSTTSTMTSPPMDQTLWICGFTIEDFEDTTLIDGLTISYSGNGFNVTRNSLARTLAIGTPWDGISLVSNDPENNIPSGSDVPLPTITTFNIAN